MNRRQLIINSINELSAERKRNSDSHDQILKSYAKNGELDASVRDTEAKLEAGTIGFSGIGESTVGTPQNLTEVFDARNRVSKASITSAFSQLKNTEGMIQRKIDDLSRQITQLEKEFEDHDCGIEETNVCIGLDPRLMEGIETLNEFKEKVAIK